VPAYDAGTVELLGGRSRSRRRPSGRSSRPLRPTTKTKAGGQSADRFERERQKRTAEEGGEVLVVPPESAGGARFDETFGVAALLRFPID